LHCQKLLLLLLLLGLEVFSAVQSPILISP
jgi:hypothetical protein